MNASSLRPASVCGGTPIAGGTETGMAAALVRRRTDTESYYNNCAASRRTSQCYSEYSNNSPQSATTNYHRTINVAGGTAGSGTVSNTYDHQDTAKLRQWTSYRTDVTGTSIRTPVNSGKFCTNFSFRQALVPEGYPKMDYERNPRRESFVAEFSRKLAEGYDIWEDADRPVINWVFPRLPIRKNKTHELRMMANHERITKMLEREKQMNKRNTRLMAMAPSTDKRETAWWERSRNGFSRTPAPHAGTESHVAPGTPRTSGSHTSRAWPSRVGPRPNFTVPRASYYAGSRR